MKSEDFKAYKAQAYLNVRYEIINIKIDKNGKISNQFL